MEHILKLHTNNQVCENNILSQDIDETNNKSPLVYIIINLLG